jgi:hypothetical protein
MRQQPERGSVTLGQALGGRYGVAPVRPSGHDAASASASGGTSIGSAAWTMSAWSPVAVVRLEAGQGLGGQDQAGAVLRPLGQDRLVLRAGVG